MLVLLAGQFHLHHLYHWMDQSLYFEYLLADGSLSHEMAEGAVDNPNFDYIIANKGAYLNGTFFWMQHPGLHRYLLVVRPFVPQVELGRG